MIHWTERHTIIPAVYLLLQRDNEIFMLRRANTGYANGQYTLPAGHLDGDEAPSTAAVREALEEAGVTVDPANLEFIHAVAYKAPEGDHERLTLFFRASKFTGEPHNAEPEKCDDARWFSIADLPSEMVWETRHALEQIKAGNVYSEANY